MGLGLRVSGFVGLGAVRARGSKTQGRLKEPEKFVGLAFHDATPPFERKIRASGVPWSLNRLCPSSVPSRLRLQTTEHAYLPIAPGQIKRADG